MRKMLALAVTGALAASLTACTVPDEELPVSTPTPTPTSEAKAEGAKAEPEAKEEAQRGSRENPLAPGEARKVGADSSFTVSASKTDYRDGYVVADFTVEVDAILLMGNPFTGGYAESGGTFKARIRRGDLRTDRDAFGYSWTETAGPVVSYYETEVRTSR